MDKFTLDNDRPVFCRKLFGKFKAINGILISNISNKTDFGNFVESISDIANILFGVKNSNEVKTGKAVIIY